MSTKTVTVRCKTDRYFVIQFFLVVFVLIFGVYVHSAWESEERLDLWIVSLFLAAEIPSWMYFLYLHTWRLTFSPDTEMMSYHSMFCRKTDFSVAEAQMELYSEQNRFGGGVKRLLITTDTLSIDVTLGYYDKHVSWGQMEGCDVHVPELVRFLKDMGKM